MRETASAVIVGASSLFGKELADALSSSERTAWDVTLLEGGVSDEGRAGTRIASAGDEAMLVQPLSADALIGSDVVFFADDSATTRKHWSAVARAGAAVVDMTGALGGEPGVATLAPGIGPAHDGVGRVVESAHPASLMLCTLLTKLRTRWPATHLAATLMIPAAEYGRAGLDALQQQTASLLTFQSADDDVFGEQSAFNLYVPSANNPNRDQPTTSERVRHDIQQILADEATEGIAVQLLQAPLFYGYAASVFASLQGGADEVRQVLEDNRILVTGPTEVCSTRIAPEDGRIAVAVAPAIAEGVWLWCVCDGLKLAAQNAIACATELLEQK